MTKNDKAVLSIGCVSLCAAIFGIALFAGAILRLTGYKAPTPTKAKTTAALSQPKPVIPTANKQPTFPEEKPEAVPPPPPPQPDWVTAPQLIASYKENEVEADAVFKRRKSFAVIGRVDRIGKSLFGQPYVNLSDGNKFSVWSAMARFPRSYENDLIHLRAGNKVIIQCSCKGRTLTMVVLEDCTFADKSELGHSIVRYDSKREELREMNR